MHGEVLDQAIELNMIAYHSPVWVKRTLLRLILWFGSPIVSRYQGFGAFESHKLQRTMKELSDITQVS